MSEETKELEMKMNVLSEEVGLLEMAVQYIAASIKSKTNEISALDVQLKMVTLPNPAPISKETVESLKGDLLESLKKEIMESLRKELATTPTKTNG